MRLLALLPLLLTLPTLAAPPAVTAVPERVVLGKDAEVVLEVRLAQGTGPVRAAASSGTFLQEAVAGGPVRTFRWTPPDVRYPLRAVLLFWVDGPEGTPPEVARVLVPLLGRTTLDIATNPGAEVVVEIGEARFGPVRANARGKAAVPVEVPPDVERARVLATRGALRTDRTTPLPVPAHRPLVAMLGPTPLYTEKGGWLVVAGAEETAPSDVELSVQGATVEPLAGSPSLFRVLPAEDATEVSVEVRRPGGSDAARASVEVLPSPLVVPLQPALLNPPPPTSAPLVWRLRGNLSFHLLAGGVLAQGANTGLTAAVGTSYRMPMWRGRLAAELELGLRQASLEAVDNFGMTRRSRVLAGPVLASARFTALERGPLSLHARVGAGVMPFAHHMSIDAQTDIQESKLEPMAFLAAQGAYRFGAWSALVELRGAHGSARTPWIDAQLGGFAINVGMRYTP